MTTLSDIAKRAGVSVATVSRVINDYPDVNDATRVKVKKVITELGYGSGALGKGRDGVKTMAIGVFYTVGHLTHPFFKDVLEAFWQVVAKRGYDMLLFTLSSDESEAEDFNSRAVGRNLDGILLVSVPRVDARIGNLAVGSIPCMSIDLDLVGARAGYLCSDNVAGSIQAMDYLISMGHSKIAFIGDQFQTKPGHDRLMGYRRSLDEHNLPFRPTWVRSGDFSEVGGYEATKRLLECEERPTAIFCAGDLMAIGAMKALHEAGLNVPDDISLVGFDDIDLASYVSPSLTTIRQRRNEIGERAAQCLLQMIDESQIIPPIVTVPTELIVRESVKSPTETQG